MIEDLLAHNIRWAASRTREDPDYFRRLSALQKPEYLWIGCSDSRVPANVITGLEPGEVFVHRNVANLVHRGDLNLLSVLEFAVETLGVRHIIVCGHYGCDGVKASMDHQHHGLLNKWLWNIKDVYRLYADELKGISDENIRADKLAEYNVREQVLNLDLRFKDSAHQMLATWPGNAEQRVNAAERIRPMHENSQLTDPLSAFLEFFVKEAF